MDLYDVSDIVSTSLDDLGVQLDTNNPSKQVSKDKSEQYNDKPIVPQVRAGEFDEDVDETLTQIENAKYASVKDPITRDNFYQSTACNWKETKELLQDDPDYTSDSGSMYWYTDEGVYRTSNHWGFGVGSCDWTLNSNPELSHRDDEGLRTGFAKWTDFTHTDEKTFPQIVEMLTPKEAGLIGETDQDTEVYYDNYRSRQLEPKEDFVEDVTYPSGIEPRIYMTCAAEGEDAQPTNVVNKVEENPVDNVSNNIVDPVSGQNGTPRNYGSKKPGATSFKNYAFELTTIEKIAEEMMVEADLESKKPYLLQQLNKADITGDEAEKVIKQINEADPTGNYATYTQWLLGQYLKGNFKLEDTDEAKELLKTFNEETKSKRLKGVNINQSKYQDLKAILEDHLGTSDKASDKLSKELENTDAEFLTSYTDKETGDKYDLIKVSDSKDAEKLFSGSDWCVRHPDTAEKYLESGNFLLLRKNGKNYLLKHPEDFKYVDDTDPTKEMQEEFNTVFDHIGDNVSISTKFELGVHLTEKDEKYLLDNLNAMLRVVDDGYGQQLIRRYLQHYKNSMKDRYYDAVCYEIFQHNYDDARELLLDGLINKNDTPTTFNEVVNYLISHGNPYLVLENNIVTKDDGELFNKAVTESIEDGFSSALLTDRIITKDDKELFDKLVNKVMENGRSYELLGSKVITKEDGDLFYKLVNDEIEKGYGYGYYLISYHVITREDKDLFTKAVEQALEVNSGYEYKLLKEKLLTKDDGDLYNKAVSVAEQNGYSFQLLKENVITKDDGEVYNYLVNKIIENKHGSDLVSNGIITEDELKEYQGENNSENTTMDESTNDDTNKESAFEFTDINKLADFVQEFNRQDELTDEQKNKFVNHMPVEEANKDLKDELIEDAKQTGKVITHIPKSLNYPYIEDEMAGNKLFYSDLDWMEMSDLSEM